MNKFYIYILFLFTINQSYAQNLIKNESFENHNPLKCVFCEIYFDKFDNLVHNWGNMNSGTKLCDCNYKRNADEIRKGNNCDTDNIKPKSGKAFIEMFYGPQWLDDAHETKGVTSYLNASFIEPLTIGKLYEVSFWIYIEQRPNSDENLPNNIGITFLPKMIIRPNRAMLVNDDFLIDKVIYDEWYQVKWIIRPTCTLRHLVIGAFRNNNFPMRNDYENESRYYIDDVVVKEVLKDNIEEEDVITPFCKSKVDYAKKEKFIEKIETVTLSFESNKSSLTESEKQKLDKFAIEAKKNPKAVFWISGHTDSKGSNHQELSKARVQAGINYLNQTYKIPIYKFISTFEGSAKPVATNETEEGRQKNRRVEIKHTNYELSQKIYYDIVKYNQTNNIDSAFLLMNVWLYLSKPSNHILVNHDNRLRLMQNNKRWKGVESRITHSYKNFKNPTYAYELEKLWAEDQKYRTLNRYVNNLGYIPILEDLAIPDTIQLPKNLHELDKTNFVQLEKLIKKYGFPKSEEVGNRAEEAAILMIIHQSDTEKMEQYLSLIKQKCLQGDLDWQFYALLFDRIKLIKKEPQQYGTQQVLNEDGIYELYKLEDKTKVNEYREELGLFPISIDK
ncbi:MAG: DUF6624 domain-containing protein [Saprospiraceae bacterium]